MCCTCSPRCCFSLPDLPPVPPDPPDCSSALSGCWLLWSAPCLPLGLRWWVPAFSVACALLDLSFALHCSASHDSVWLPEPWQSRAFPGAVRALSLVFCLFWLCPSLLVSSFSGVFSSLVPGRFLSAPLRAAFCTHGISPVPLDPSYCSSALSCYSLFSSAPCLPLGLRWLELAFAVASAPLDLSFALR